MATKKEKKETAKEAGLEAEGEEGAKGHGQSGVV